MYRREVDGLRTLAVMPVILFHAGVSVFQGGYVGVDVFFVISGFLITNIILEEKRKGAFSIIGFYERRARRILPALIFVVFATIPFAWTYLSPKDLRDYAQSVASVSLFASNFLFWDESGYFDTEAELKPLLHTWSLAVEEQYYILFPVLIFVVWRLGHRRVMGSFIGLALLSLGAAIWQVQAAPAAAFFLLPARAWELLVGAMAALALSNWISQEDIRLRFPRASEALGLIGIALIAGAVLTFDETTPFPGLLALIPTVGAALVLVFASAQTLAGRVLGLAPFVWIGLISYSAYLWHQPVFAFARHISLGEVPQSVFLALTVLSLGLAYLSWRFVEQPFRARTGFSRRSIFALSAAGTAVMLALGVTGHVAHKTITALRLGDGGVGWTAYRDKDDLITERSDAYAPFLKLATAPFESEGDRSRVLIFGDSVANDLYGSVMLNGALFPGSEFRRQPLDESCMPGFDALLRTGDAGRPASDQCARELAGLVAAPLLEDADIVVLNAHWRETTRSATHDNALALADTLVAQGKKVLIMGLLSMKDAPSIAFLALQSNMTRDEANRFAYRALRRSLMDGPNAAVAAHDGIVFLDKEAVFCDRVAQACRLFREDGDILFSDSHHVSKTGAEYFGRRIAELNWFD